LTPETLGLLIQIVSSLAILAGLYFTLRELPSKIKENMASAAVSVSTANKADAETVAAYVSNQKALLDAYSAQGMLYIAAQEALVKLGNRLGLIELENASLKLDVKAALATIADRDETIRATDARTRDYPARLKLLEDELLAERTARKADQETAALNARTAATLAKNAEAHIAVAAAQIPPNAPADDATLTVSAPAHIEVVEKTAPDQAK
jgi:hypothetical protein